MMGPAKLSTIRAELRESLGMSDAELEVWFDRRLGELTQKPKASPTELDTLRLLRDALLRESKRGEQSKKPRRVRARGRK
jgi:hypothetical protein